jgi:hypothetical protein
MEPFGLTEPMPCYEFNESLPPGQDDGRCVDCRRYLTLECPYIAHFLGEDEE